MRNVYCTNGPSSSSSSYTRGFHLAREGAKCLPHSGLADRIQHRGRPWVSSLPRGVPEACPSGLLDPASVSRNPQGDSDPCPVHPTSRRAESGPPGWPAIVVLPSSAAFRPRRHDHVRELESHPPNLCRTGSRHPRTSFRGRSLGPSPTSGTLYGITLVDGQ